MPSSRVCSLVLSSLFWILIMPSEAQSQRKAAGFSGGIPQMSKAQQENFPPQLLDQLEAIKAAALADDYAYRQVAHLTENIGPRPSGSAQARAAVDYVANELRHIGLEVSL